MTEKISSKQMESSLNSTPLESISIFKLFGRYNIEMDFKKEVNIYIGENGLGKTTILNCVYYLLTQKFNRLIEIDFKEIHVKLTNNASHLVFKRKTLVNHIGSKFDRYEQRYGHKRDLERLEFLLSDLKYRQEFEIVDESFVESTIMQLSRHVDLPRHIIRKTIFKFFETGTLKPYNTSSPSEKEIRDLKKSIDILKKSINFEILNLPTYRRIETDFSELVIEERGFRDSDRLIQFGMADVNNTIKKILNEIRDKSINSFNNMTSILLKQYAKPQGHSRSDTSHLINSEDIKIIFGRLGNQVSTTDQEQIFHLLSSKQIYNEEYVYLYDLIQKLTENYDIQKKVDDKVKCFVEVCNNYLNDKKFIYDQNNLKLDIHLTGSANKENNIITLQQLSSGEKQIVSLFSKLYLDDVERIIIIDEPELSLSMHWQQMLLPDIMNSKNCKLLLTVTHSPFIFDNDFDSEAKEIRALMTDLYTKEGI